MEIKITEYYETEVYHVLNNVPDNMLYNNEHCLLRPLRIYDRSIERVFKSFHNFIEIFLYNYNLDFDKINWEKIDECHKEILDSIMAFIDDGYQIMKCFYPESSVRQNIVFADKWLEKAEYSLIKDYKRCIKPYRERIACINNKIKHNHGRYQNIECTYIYGKALGYYIEGIDDKGIVIPNKDIHKMYNGMYTGISFNKDIRDLLTNVYIVAHYMAKTIRKILKKKFGYDIEIIKQKSDRELIIMDIFKQVISINEVFFPDEYNEELPEMILAGELITIRKPSSKKFRDKLLKFSTPSFAMSSIVEYGLGAAMVYFKGKSK